jgi:Protein of unknown function (DUF2800)
MTNVTDVIDQNELPAHSPLGGSAAERYIECPGSVALIEAIRKAQTHTDEEEPGFRIEGSVAHEAAAHALKNKLEAWELVDMEFLGHKVTAEMTDDIEVYLQIARDTKDEDKTLNVTDFKFGMGVVVEVEHNPQLMYYAFGLLDRTIGGTFVEERFHRPDLHKHYFGTADLAVVGIGEIEFIKLRIVQPRAFHPKGPVREWTISVNDLRKWGNEVLLPAMEQTEWDETLNAGEHCRFCEGRVHCSALQALKDAMVERVERGVAGLPLEVLVDEYMTIAPIKMRIKALEEAVYNALNRGEEDERIKLVAKRADRIWKDGAEAAAKEEFGDDAVDKPAFKSPPGIDKLGPRGKEFCKEHAYTPLTGTTVALASDKRAPIKVLSKAESFKELIANEAK